jgi:hypothetical protein
MGVPYCAPDTYPLLRRKDRDGHRVRGTRYLSELLAQLRRSPQITIGPHYDDPNQLGCHRVECGPVCGYRLWG